MKVVENHARLSKSDALQRKPHLCARLLEKTGIRSCIEKKPRHEKQNKNYEINVI